MFLHRDAFMTSFDAVSEVEADIELDIDQSFSDEAEASSGMRIPAQQAIVSQICDSLFFIINTIPSMVPRGTGNLYCV